jgi:hypothetical protein
MLKNSFLHAGVSLKKIQILGVETKSNFVHLKVETGSSFVQFLRVGTVSNFAHFFKEICLGFVNFLGVETVSNFVHSEVHTKSSYVHF